MRYARVTDGEWVRPFRRGYRMACCDCGAVHVVNFRVKDGAIEFQPTRNSKATWALRRRDQGMAKKAKKTATRNPQDTTLRNVRAANTRIVALEAEVANLKWVIELARASAAQPGKRRADH